MVGRQVADDRRLDVEAAGEVAIGQVLAAGEDRAVATRLATACWWRSTAFWSMTGPEPVRPWQRVADRDRLGLLDEQPDELVVDGPLDVDPRVRRAFLAAEPERRAHDALGRLLEVRVTR